MPEQREKPGATPQELATCFGWASAEGITVSGGQVENFKRGWAIGIMRDGKVSHWFERDRFENATALCGAKSMVRWIYGPGNFQKCQRCIRVQSKLVRSGR